MEPPISKAVISSAASVGMTLPNAALMSILAPTTMVTSGLRIGSPASTTRGFKEAEMTQVAGWIADIIDAGGSAEVIARVRAEVAALCKRFPVYGKQQ
jgi:glycine/serine hydroxymethyltransferase